MFRKILYPTDFSNVAEKALAYVKKLREAGTEEVIILHVIDENDLEVMLEPCLWSGENIENCEKKTERRMREKARKNMMGIKDELEKTGMKVRISVKIGKPFVKIVETAKKEGVSLIVMGSHGRGMVKEMFLGSVAESVIHHATTPVMIVRR